MEILTMEINKPMMIVVFFVIGFAVYGLCVAAFQLGGFSYRVSMAIDELLKQRKERKK